MPADGRIVGVARSQSRGAGVDFRPVGYVIGLVVGLLGLTMLIPCAVDVAARNGEAWTFLTSSFLTATTGGLVALACRGGAGKGLTRQQSFLLTAGVWGLLPVFGAIPFMVGAPDARLVDAIFEAMSGMTTTGSTVFTGLPDLPAGTLIWRSMLQWFGGIGIIVVAMVFLPELKIGGMQIFRSEAFDTFGKILPRAAEIAQQIAWLYVGLTMTCFLGYLALGLPRFDAINHAFTTIATGGFSTRDASFSAFKGPPEYWAGTMMILASLPFVRYVQLVAGTARPLFLDPQVRAFLTVIGAVIAAIALWRIVVEGAPVEPAIRETLFNTASLMTGTGYASADYQLWGAFPVTVLFLVGLIGGCAGSTCCSVKIFRYQILLSAVRAQVQKIHSPHGMFQPRFDGRPVGEDALASVMAFFTLFLVSFGVFAALLSATGLDLVTSISGAATAISNIGPGFGEIIGPTGTFAPLNDAAKWICTIAMFVGRLELLTVYTILTLSFWRT